MRIQAVYKQRPYSYDADWLDAFVEAGAEKVSYDQPARLDADLVVILHSVSAQWGGYPSWLVAECQARTGKLVVFHTNEFKNVQEREAAAMRMGADFIATQLPDGRLYSMPTISMPHALNPKAFYNMRLRRDISVGFRGADYKAGINDLRKRIVSAFAYVLDADIVLDKHGLFGRDEWAAFLNRCKAIPGAEAGNEGARIISPRHLEAAGCGTLQILAKGDYCGVLQPQHYVEFTSVDEAMAIVHDDRRRNEITGAALEHLLSQHTHKHRIEHLFRSVWQNRTPSRNSNT